MVPPAGLCERVALAPYTTLGVGGEARYFLRVTTEDALRAADAWAKAQHLPLLCLGGGSNLLIGDGGWPGVVVQMGITGRQYDVQADGTVIATLGAGEVLDDVVADTTARGWWGLENLTSIPGTVGATPVQNVGAYGVEMSDLVESVTVYDMASGTRRTLTPSACQFGYRDSCFKHTAGASLIITSVVVRLSTAPRPRLGYADVAARVAARTLTPTPAVVREVIAAIRADKFPDWTKEGTAGSFFQNPIITQSEAARLTARYPDLPVYAVSETHVKVSLGYILDQVCHLKGWRHGHVRLYERQALVLVADAGTTAAEIHAFAQMVTARVHTATGIGIHPEVTMRGEINGVKQ